MFKGCRSVVSAQQACSLMQHAFKLSSVTYLGGNHINGNSIGPPKSTLQGQLLNKIQIYSLLKCPSQFMSAERILQFNVTYLTLHIVRTRLQHLLLRVWL